MARINIEDQFWLDILRVAAKIGDEDKAVGNVVRFFRFAQEKHKRGELVSEEEFMDCGFSVHMFPIFAKHVDGGIQAVGAAKYFSWLFDKSDAGRIGGQHSAQRARDEKGRLLPKQTPSNAQADQANESAGPENSKQPSKPKLSQASPSSSLSLNKKVSTKKESVVAEEASLDFGDGPASAAADVVFFETVPELRGVGDPQFQAAISRISTNVQKSWVARYDHAWLRNTLLNAVHHFMEKENALNASQINEWGLKLGRWLRREKKPRLYESGENFEDELNRFETQISTGGEKAP